MLPYDYINRWKHELLVGCEVRVLCFAQIWPAVSLFCSCVPDLPPYLPLLWLSHCIPTVSCPVLFCETVLELFMFIRSLCLLWFYEVILDGGDRWALSWTDVAHLYSWGYPWAKPQLTICVLDYPSLPCGGHLQRTQIIWFWTERVRRLRIWSNYLYIKRLRWNRRTSDAGSVRTFKWETSRELSRIGWVSDRRIKSQRGLCFQWLPLFHVSFFPVCWC